jgi:hypothetical protein
MRELRRSLMKWFYRQLKCLMRVRLREFCFLMAMGQVFPAQQNGDSNKGKD